MNNYCAFCKHFIGGGDWGLCCDLEHEDYPCGFLCYEDTDACEKYEEDYRAKRAFIAGLRHKEDSMREVYVVTVVEYIDGDACDPTNFIFDNETAANECFKYFSKQKHIKLSMEQEIVFARCPKAQGDR